MFLKSYFIVRECTDLSKELSDRENEYLQNLKKHKIDKIDIENDKELQTINTLRSKVQLRLNEKGAIAANLATDFDRIIKKLDTDILDFENELKLGGVFDNPLLKGAEPGTDVAIHPSVGNNDIILGRVVSFNMETRYYDITDIDDTSRRYHLYESQVYFLDVAELYKKLSKGDEIYAVYPDTTSFYPAVVVQGPKKSNTGDFTLSVQFQGDADETGITPVVTVPMHYVIRPPR